MSHGPAPLSNPTTLEMQDAISLVHYVTKRNVRAFLWALRYGEGTQGEEGYQTLFGGMLFKGHDGIYQTFDDFADHPRLRVSMKLKKGGTLTSTAAGAYQFLERTWDSLVAQYGFANFEPTNQDLAAIALIAGRGALDDVVAGRIDVAVMKCNKEWASLPGSPYGQPVVTLDVFKREYEEAHGLYSDEDNIIDVTARSIGPTAQIMRAEPPALPAPKLPPVEDRIPVPVEVIRAASSEIPSLTTERNVMLPALIPALLPSLIALVPQLAKLFGSGSDVSNRNIAAATAVFNVAKEAIGAKNEQEVIEAIQSDPTQSEAVKKAIERNYLQIEEAGGGGIEGARAFALASATLKDAEGHTIPLRQQPAFIISCIMLALVVGMAVVVLFPWELWMKDGKQIYTDEVRLIVVTAIIGMLSTIGAFWLGSSFANRQKDNTITALSTRQVERL